MTVIDKNFILPLKGVRWTISMFTNSRNFTEKVLKRSECKTYKENEK